MSSATERAVEAAREAGRRLAGDHPGALREAFGDVAVAGFRAAFPILAEDLVEIALDENSAAIEAGIHAKEGPKRWLPIGRSEAAIAIAKGQRALVRQTAEAEIAAPDTGLLDRYIYAVFNDDHIVAIRCIDEMSGSADEIKRLRESLRAMIVAGDDPDSLDVLPDDWFTEARS